jgi:hypothetical protein
MRPEVVAKLDGEYQKLKRTQTKSLSDARAELQRYVSDLTSDTTTAQANTTPSESTQGTGVSPSETEPTETEVR